MYIPLNIKTDYSINHSIIKIDDLISYALKNNIKALTITDDNMFGALEFYQKCMVNNIKPIIGINVKLNDLDIILYARNYKGYQELLKISNAYRENSLDSLESSDNIIVIIPCESRDLYKELKDKFKYLYISYQNDEQKEKVKSSNKLYMKEVLYLEESDKKIYEIYQVINGKEYNGSNYLYQDVEDNSFLNDLIDLKIEFNNNLLPEIKDADKLLQEECIKGLKEIFGEKASMRYINRLKEELNTIKKMGFSAYFLIVSDYVKYAKGKGILVGPGRGSAVGSLVAYTLKITEIDPLKYDLLFERFLNEERVTMPDIDIDFDALRREEVIDYCRNKYGFDKVAGIITFQTLGLKQAIKLVGPILEISDGESNYLINNLEDNKFDNLKELLEISKKLEGLKTNISAHASGVVISKEPLENYVPLETHDGKYLVGYTKDYIESLGLLKMDFLALKNLTLISKIKEDIGDIEIKLNDKETFEIFNSGNTEGIFQFETAGLKNALNNFKISSFTDIYNLSALFRPGPKDNINSYIKRKEGKEKISYYDPSLEPILKSTYGIIIYQEQIMQIACTIASYTLGEADILRRAMSKKDESKLKKEHPKFIERAINNGYSKELAEELYAAILKFASYGFNKSHSVAYAKISYDMAYLKAHYKEIFMKHLLESVMGSKSITKDYIDECKKNNITLYNPSINKSMNNYVVDNGIHLPFNLIDKLSYATIDEIISNRGKGYSDVFDFLLKVNVNKETFESLVKAGVFDEFETRKTLIENADVILNYVDLKKDLGDSIIKPNIIKQEEYTKKELVALEYETYGFYINNNPIEEYRDQYKNHKSLSALANYMNRYIDIIVFVSDIHVIISKGQKICFLKVNDTYSIVEAVVFNDNYLKMPELKVNDIILLSGKVARRNGHDQIIVNNIKIL